MRNLLGIMRINGKYKQIKESDNSKTSIRLGIFAIIIAILMVGVSAIAPLSLKIIGGTESIIIAVLGILLMLFAVMGYCLLLVHTVLYVVLQLKLNKKVIGFVALIFLILSITGSILMLIFLI